MNLTDSEIKKAGGTVRKIRLPDRPAQQKLLHGIVIVRFRVEGRPIPWSVSRRGTKNPALSDWQRKIANAAREAHGMRVAYPHRVKLLFWFCLKAIGPEPDLTNLEKAAEDALQRIIIVNDRQVITKEPHKVWGADNDYALIEVRAWE